MSSDTDRDPRPEPFDHPPRPLVQRVGAVLWPSFFAAGVATMVFFANVDPLELAGISFSDLEVSRELGYSIGFFMFWSCTAASSLFTWLLLRPRSRYNHRPPRTEGKDAT
ncbi:MAG: hypothetical protein IPO95_02100 [Rhodanobacteraceae bacterium]|nr:hypothetical protein [Rhodanobacteraceae bacterium]